MKQFLIVINDKAIISYHSVTVKMFKMRAGLFDSPDTQKVMKWDIPNLKLPPSSELFYQHFMVITITSF